MLADEDGAEGMCWSTTADLRAGIALTGLAVVSLGMVRQRRHLLLALCPLLLAIHQLIESRVWATLQHGQADNIWSLLWGLIAAPALAFFGPVAVLLAFPHRWKQLLPSLIAGCFVGLMAVTYSCIRGVTATQNHHVLDYNLHVPLLPLMIVLYQLATWGSLILSGDKYVRQTGIGIGLAGGIAALVDIGAYFSVWCAFGAVVILLNIRWLRHAQPAAGSAAVTVPEQRSDLVSVGLQHK